MRVIGYYLDCDDAVCEDCLPYNADDPTPIFSDSEGDTPTHCVECGELIRHSLTEDGLDYVKAAYCDDPGSKIAQEWVNEYLPGWLVDLEEELEVEANNV